MSDVLWQAAVTTCQALMELFLTAMAAAVRTERSATLRSAHRNGAPPVPGRVDHGGT